MFRYDIRLFGGFEVSLGPRPVTRFESQRARALLCYLVANPGRSFSRDRLVALIWPQLPETAARHNLRQALYNLRTALQVDSGAPLLTSDHRSIRFDPGENVRVDLHVFEQALDGAWNSGPTGDPQRLATAAQEFRGDFLSGFFLDEAAEFEEWLRSEQERLREAAAAALRSLVAHHLQAGSFVLGIQYARKLLQIDPLAEEVHRQLMLLYTYTGRRSRALEDYEQLLRLLEKELGVEPSEETRRLYEQLSDQSFPQLGSLRRAEPVGPLIPLVGRDEAMARLAQEWRLANRGQARVVLVEGEAGVGKTRLLRSFLHDVSSRQAVTILLGRSYELAPPIPFQPIVEALHLALTSEVEIAERVAKAPPSGSLADVARLVPTLGEMKPELAADPQDRDLPLPVARLAASIGVFLRQVVLDPEALGSGRGKPLVLFLDNLQWADEATCELLAALLPEIVDLPLWVVLAYRPRELSSEAMVTLHQESERPGSRVRVLTLDRLEAESVARIAVSMVGKEGSAALARYLFSCTQGDPLLLAERINLLWDEGRLLSNGKTWRVAVPAQELGAPSPVSYEEVVSRRLAKLPASSRRLLTLAAVVGQSFEAWLLETAEQEDGQVVESCMELLLQRWMVRQFLRYWADSRRERDLAMWLQGARHGTFEFAHSSIRRTIARTLGRDRAQVLHRRVARALEERHASNPEAVCEWLGYHYMNARVWAPACDYFEAAAKKASRLAPDIGRYYLTEALKALEKLDREQGEDGKSEREERRRRLREARAGL